MSESIDALGPPGSSASDLADLIDALRRPTGSTRGQWDGAADVAMPKDVSSTLETFARRHERGAGKRSPFTLIGAPPALLISSVTRVQESAALEWLAKRLDRRLFTFDVREISGTRGAELDSVLEPMLDGRACLVHLKGIDCATQEISVVIARRTNDAALVASFANPASDLRPELARHFKLEIDWQQAATEGRAAMFASPRASAVGR